MRPDPAGQSFRAPRPLGATGLSVSAIAAGTGRWRIHDDCNGPTFDDALDVYDAITSGGFVSVIDTSNNYGNGQSECWIRRASDRVGRSADLLIQTKADRDYETGDFSGSRMRQSVEESLERLDADRLPLVFLHDPEFSTVSELSKSRGAIDTLLGLRDEGVIGSLGVAGGTVEVMLELVRTGLFDALITHNRFTLVERSAEALIDEAHDRGMGVYNAAPFGGGALTAWPRTTNRYCYRESSPALLRVLDRVGSLTELAGIPVAAAALQWSVRDPRIDSTIVGMESRADYDRTMALLDVEIPDSVWHQLSRVNAIRQDQSTGR